MPFDFVARVKAEIDFICLHKGYSGFNYGCPPNPLIFSYDEFVILNDFLIKTYKYDILDIFAEPYKYSALLPEDIQKTLGKRVVGAHPLQDCLFDDDAARERSKAEKEELLMRIREANATKAEDVAASIANKPENAEKAIVSSVACQVTGFAEY